MKNKFLTKLIYSLLIIAFFIGCEKKVVKKYYHDTGELLSEIEFNQQEQKDGQLREYYKTGELKTVEYYKNGKLIDTTFGYNKEGYLTVKRYKQNDVGIYERFYKNGNLLSKGIMKDTIAEGWWSYYNESGGLQKKVEYLNALEDSLVRNIQHPNQIIYYDSRGQIMKDSSNYFTIDLKDTIPFNNLTIGYLDLVPQISKKSNLHWVYFWQEDTFGNITKVDTTYGTNDKKAKFWLFPKKTGESLFKGFILEEGKEVRIDEKDTAMVDILSIKKKIFFEKVIFVKDTTTER